MELRREQRHSLVLSVRVSGTDSNGQPFSQASCTLDVNNHGARLYGVRCIKGLGEIVNLYKNNKGRFRVVWVGESRTPRDGQIGLLSLEPERDIWGLAPVPKAAVNPAGPQTAPPQAAAPATAAKTGTILRMLADWFEVNPTLDRAQFLAMVDRQKPSILDARDLAIVDKLRSKSEVISYADILEAGSTVGPRE